MMGDVIQLYEPKRWTVGIAFRTDKGVSGAAYAIEEIEELHDIVESGPHWDTISSITIVLNRPAERADLTIEQAERL